MQYFKGYAPLVFDLEQYKPQNGEKKQQLSTHISSLYYMYGKYL